MMPTQQESMADFRKRSMKRNFSSNMSFRRGKQLLYKFQSIYSGGASCMSFFVFLKAGV